METDTETPTHTDTHTRATATHAAPSSPATTPTTSTPTAATTPTSRATSARRAALLVLAVGSLVVGAHAQLWPQSFHDTFPLGRGWVAADGPYNEHLVRDVGGLNLALFVVALWAARRPRPDVVRLAALTTLVFGFPHLLYHGLHLEPFEVVDAVAVVATLAVSVTISAWLLVSPGGDAGDDVGDDAGGVP